MKKFIRILILFVVLIGFTVSHRTNILAINHTIREAPDHSTAHTDTMIQPGSVDLDWTFECVDCPKTFNKGTDRSLRIDQEGNPHIAYGGNHLYYFWHDGATWHSETVDPSQGVGEYASLALDNLGYPHISYRSGYPDRDLKYAVLDSDGWHIQIIDHDIGSPTSISVDQQGLPHIVYNNNEGLKYAFLENGNWQIEILDNDCCLDEAMSMALDQDGYPHISYGYEYDVKYTYRDEAGWHTTLVDRSEYFNEQISIILDEQSRPHISYFDNMAGKLKYAFLDPPFWQLETVDSITVQSTSIDIDGQGVIHISYKTDLELRYATRESDGWQSEVVSRLAYDPDHLTVSLAIGNQNLTNIAYIESYELKLASQVETGWEISIVEYGGGAGWGNSLVMDDSGSPHVSYFNTSAVMYAYKDLEGWQREVVDKYSGYPTINPTSIALDKQGIPHISYAIPNNYARMYAHRTLSGWHKEVVAYAFDEEGDMVLDENGVPHIVYNQEVFGPEGYKKGLRHAYKVGETWQTEWLSTEYGLDISISWSAGKLFTSYIKHFPGGLVFENQIVDEQGTYSGYGATDLAMDDAYNVCISYYIGDWDFMENRFAQKTASGWEITVPKYSGYSSIVLDEQGFPHMVTHGEEFVYAYQDPDGWNYHILNSTRGGGYTSLSLDRENSPHITYRSDNDLKYAYLSKPIDQSPLRPLLNWGYALPGATITHALKVVNTGIIPDTYDLTVTSHSWTTVSPGTVGPLEPGESSAIEIQVSIPSTVTLVSSDTATITLTSQNDPTVSASATLTTYAAITTYLPLVAR